MNKVELIGRLTKDIELKKTQSNMSVCQFTIAVNRVKKEGQPDADFISCIAWNKTAELLDKYVAKGNRIGIVGRLQTRSYEGKNGKVYATEVVVDELEFLENKKEQKEQPTEKNETVYLKDIDTSDTFIDDEDLPF